MSPMLSILLPSKEETDLLWATMEKLHKKLSAGEITHEFVVVNDVREAGQGGTAKKMQEFSGRGMNIQYVERLPPVTGFGSAIREGLTKFRAPAVMVLMSDGCEDPADVVRFYH
jgi:dolichol-phosphate mannosyltransferase